MIKNKAIESFQAIMTGDNFITSDDNIVEIPDRLEIIQNDNETITDPDFVE